MSKSGIYGLINIVTGKVYVGQAFVFKKRWANHEVELRLNRHCNPYLQASWNKYTEECFIFIVSKSGKARWAKRDGNIGRKSKILD